ncbi:hypothetical protein [Streptomyces diastatochromogenes]|uniref:hypothetical protein n=1 Tax=Streptomyces diastatochromogenes TaxID=42236 RepID=UPI0036CE42A8
MASKIRRPGAAAVALAAATAAAVVWGPALPAAASGYSASAGPWGTAVGLTESDGQQSLIDVKVAGDGTAFALWRDKQAGADSWEIQAAVRPAGSGTWSAPKALVTNQGASADAVLAVTADGGAIVTWLTGSGADGSVAARFSTWDAATGGWSDPGTIAATDGLYMSTPRLAAAADGTVTAVWDQSDGSLKYKVMTATLAPGGSDWSAAEPLGSVSGGTVWDIDLAVAPDGTATTVWEFHDTFEDDKNAVSTVTRSSAGGDWSSPAVLPGTTSASSGVQVSMDTHDRTTVLWHDGSSTANRTDLKSATRTSPTGDWGSAQTVAGAIDDRDSSGPLAAPNGDVTYVWAGWSTSAGTPVVQASTRSAATGTWSAPKTLSTGYVNWQVSAAIGADGTVQVVWPQTPSIDNGDDHYLEWAVRADGTWSKATALNSTPVADVPNTDALSGDVAAGPDGRATVVWRQAVYASPASYTSQLWTQSQTLLTKPEITSKAAVTGTARTGSKLTCNAAWTGYNTTAAWSWLRDGKTISGATGKTRTLTSDDYTHKVSCRITVSNGAGSTHSTSPALTVAVGPALKVTKAPAVTGTAKVGAKLTAAHGTWSPTATSYTYSWKRNGHTITGATKSTYVPVKADRGQKITVKVTAHRYGWTNGSATTASVTVR